MRKLIGDYKAPEGCPKNLFFRIRNEIMGKKKSPKRNNYVNIAKNKILKDGTVKIKQQRNVFFYNTTYIGSSIV
jgi:hypothetical protein